MTRVVLVEDHDMAAAGEVGLPVKGVRDTEPVAAVRWLAGG